MEKKMKNFRRILFCAGAFAALCACNDNGAVAAETVSPAMSAHGEPAMLGAHVENGALVVALAGNPTTGYEWHCKNDGNCLLGGDYEFVRDSADGDMLGVGGVFVFRFTPKAAGTETLRFSYARSWEDEIAESVEYAVIVSGTEGNYTIECVQN